MENGETRGMLTIVNFFLEYSLPILAFVLLLWTDYNPWLIGPIFVAFFLLRFLHRFDAELGMPPVYYTLGLVAVYASIFGEFFFELYYNLLHYDKILHFLVSVYLALLIAFFTPQMRMRALFIVLAVMGLGAMYEIFEYGVDTLSGATVMQGVVIDVKEMMGGLDDTMKDLMAALVGSICGCVIERLSLRPLRHPHARTRTKDI